MGIGKEIIKTVRGEMSRSVLEYLRGNSYGQQVSVPRSWSWEE